MRPDYSIYIRPGSDEPAKFEPVVLHFDAKYRLNFLSELFGSDEPNQLQSGKSSPPAEPVRDDLLKMHAYRDAIRRSVGAYVIYPGTEHELMREYHELLPGLGAFALRPAAGGHASGTAQLSQFLEDVLNHVASQVSQDERGRYWLRETFSGTSYAELATPPAHFLSAPPADTPVLLGYVRDLKHWQWIERTRLYNIRADGARGAVELGSRHLASEIVVLSCPDQKRVALYRVTMAPVVRSIDEMRKLEYPNPRGTYFCFSVEEIQDSPWTRLLSTDRVEQLRAERTGTKGAPVAVTWLELVARL
jgi:hypothetical protein